MSSALAARPVDSTKPRREFCTHVFAIAESEVRKLAHDPTEVLARVVQPLTWLLVFGPVLAHIRGIPTGDVGYIDFMVPGIVAQGVLFISVVYGVALLWERDAGILHRYMATPASRVALVSGKALSAGVRVMPQALFVYLIAIAMRVHLRLTPLAILEVTTIVILGSAVFCTLSLMIACVANTRERFMGINQLLTFPCFFASNAIYPVSLMPVWLRRVSVVNPLTYVVDGLRGVMLPMGHSQYGVGFDVAVQVAMLLIFLFVAAKLYPRVTY